MRKMGLTNLAAAVGGPLDAFICGASYEDRCGSIASQLSGVQIETVLVGVNENLERHVGRNAEKLLGLFGGTTRRVSMDSTDPLRIADSWMAELDALPSRSPRRWLVDITTFTHEALLIVLKLLRQHTHHGDTCMLAYASAGDYDAPRRGEEKWLSKGVAEVRSVLGYPGAILPSKKTHLVVLVGYEHERATRLIESFEPNRISLGCGSKGSGTSPKHEEANRRFHELASEMAARFAPVEKFEFPSDDPWGTKEAIRSQLGKYPEYNVVIAPMNTKMSTLGCALLAWELDTIQVCYAQAIRYNYAHYSLPGDCCYLFEFPELVAGE